MQTISIFVTLSVAAVLKAIIHVKLWVMCAFPFFFNVFVSPPPPQRKPAVLRGVNLGPCLEKWTVEYLRQRGSEREVKIHVSTVPQMDFLHKNFVYK